MQWQSVNPNNLSAIKTTVKHPKLDPDPKGLVRLSSNHPQILKLVCGSESVHNWIWQKFARLCS